MMIPSQLNNELEEALTRITQHPTHEYGPKQRQKLFNLFNSDPFTATVWKWLAIVTARHVFPIYESYAVQWNEDEWDYDLKFPLQSLEMAEKILLGEEDAETGWDMGNIAYDPHSFTYVAWRTHHPVPFNIYQASWAASMALLEVSSVDYDLFEDLPNIAYWEGGFLWEKGVGATIRNSHPDAVLGEEYTDVLWARSGHSDTAAAAVSAWACEGLSTDPHPEKMLQFWRWWITEAVPQAWELAEAHAGQSNN
jgi:hypothetical protein